jgi:hypothetical protein
MLVDGCPWPAPIEAGQSGGDKCGGRTVVDQAGQHGLKTGAQDTILPHKCMDAEKDVALGDPGGHCGLCSNTARAVVFNHRAARAVSRK